MKKLTYEEYKTNYNKLTKAEVNSREYREFRDRMLKEAEQEGLRILKANMQERIANHKAGLK